jgi:hypothetical protein
VWYGWCKLQRRFGSECLLLINFTQSQNGKGLADGSGRCTNVLCSRIMNQRLDDDGSCAAPRQVPTNVAELVDALNSGECTKPFTYTSTFREAGRVVKGNAYLRVPDDVCAASPAGVCTVAGSSKFFSVRVDLASLNSDAPAIYAAELSCRCHPCSTFSFDEECEFAGRRPTGWKRYELKLKPVAASDAGPTSAAGADVSEEEEGEAEEIAVEASEGSVIAIPAPDDGEQPFYLIQVKEVKTLTASTTNSALLDARGKAVKFDKGERVVVGYWLNRTGTADTANLPPRCRYEYVELWNDAWRDTGTWEEGSAARSWLQRSKHSVDVMVRAADVRVWDVSVEEAPERATAMHHRSGYPGWIGVLTADALDMLAEAFGDEEL